MTRYDPVVLFMGYKVNKILKNKLFYDSNSRYYFYAINGITYP